MWYLQLSFVDREIRRWSCAIQAPFPILGAQVIAASDGQPIGSDLTDTVKIV